MNDPKGEEWAVEACINIKGEEWAVKACINIANKYPDPEKENEC